MNSGRLEKEGGSLILGITAMTIDSRR
jgi:hypothetical protein